MSLSFPPRSIGELEPVQRAPFSLFCNSGTCASFEVALKQKGFVFILAWGLHVTAWGVRFPGFYPSSMT